MPRILITGANRGLGLGVARILARRGWQVHATCRNPAKAEALAALAKDTGRVTVHALEVTDFPGIERLGRELADAAIDVLLNNAGIMNASQRTFDRGSNAHGLGQFDDDEWMQVLRVNTMAPLKMAEVFVEHVARSDRKVMATISSIMGSIGELNAGRWYPYRTSKTAVNMVMRNLAADLKPRGIAAIAIHPGWVRTEMGGPSAAVSIEDSTSGLAEVIERASFADSGKFLTWQGKEMAW
ncbi:MAG: SDR family oxidoreductase [Alphaproteobacteria bacterium]|nr:SDR family oxidoreductase [Alphaproteobacteria bacterium]